MKFLAFAKRNAKEIIRDPLNLFFGLGFPLVLLLLLSIIQKNIPVDLFEIEHLTPGVTVFGLSFITLFSAVLISKDRETAFFARLYTTPFKPSDFILGYILPLLPIALTQGIICYITAMILGLKPSLNIIIALIFLGFVSLFYIGLGLLCGCILNSKQVGGVCGALLTNFSAWLSGIWFDINLMGETFKKIANFLPFIHAVELERKALSGEILKALPHFLVILGYTFFVLALAIFIFLKKMKNNK
ncbi:MAG: ABC transporter permease [Clostridia bacterium]|nr:ABC transporter permease [Clostridia bacterium]